MFSKNANTQLSSILDVIKVLAVYALVVVGVFFHTHLKELLTYYALLFLAVTLLTRKSWGNRKA